MGKIENRTFLWFSFGALLLIAAFDLFVLISVVPKFEQIFQDTLPGKPLPSGTNFVIAYRFYLAALITGWLIFCWMMLRRGSQHSILYTNIGLVWTLLQIGFVIVALFSPMVGTEQGLGGEDVAPLTFPTRA